MTNSRTYSTETKASCIALLSEAGYPRDVYALKRVAKATDVSTRSLRRWWNACQDIPAADNKANNEAAMAELVSEKRLEIKDLLGEIVLGLALEAKDRIDRNALGIVTLQQLMTALGIAIDKHQLVTGKPTSRNANVQEELEEMPEDERAAVVAEAERYLEDVRRGRTPEGDSGLPDW